MMENKNTILYNFFNKKVEGSALYISIMISIAIGIFLTLFILVSRYNQRTVTVFSQTSQLYYNLNSAFEIARSSYFTRERNGKWFKNTIDDDSIRIKKLSWGAYLLIEAETKNRHELIAKSGLFGTYLNSDTGLVVAENDRPIGMSGKIEFKAHCYLPKAGIKPAFIEGQSYQGSSGNTNFLKNSPAQIQTLNETYITAIEEQISNEVFYTDSIVNVIPEKLANSFSRKTIVLKTNQLTLSNLDLKNNIKIIAQNITVDNTCTFDNILIVCKKIKFREGFNGTVQVIASDSILMEKKCTFNYPSSFILLSPKEKSTSLKCIQLNEDCAFSGGIIAYNDPLKTESGKVFIKLNAKSEVNGLIYSSDYTHIEGKVNGSLFSNKLLIKTPSAVYENYLLGCEINPKKYSHFIGVPMIFNKSKLICCKNLL